ncbi:MAG: permease [Bacteroidales bacterium]|jgi:uncharacterized membrane protein YraQ (UPF0718 family)|nr:permease [Bacteroidales bacterium]
METKKELKFLFWIVAIFAGVFFLPLTNEAVATAITASLDLAKWYAQEHIILCLLPAFFIAGAIAVFINQSAVLKYFGASAKKWLSYTFAAVSGGLLAVCSCTILPLFSSIYKRGAGLGPAVVFLYSGPAFSILSLILTWRILGVEIGIARMIGAISFSIIIGLAMAFIYRKEEKAKKEEQMNFPTMPDKRPIWQTSLHFLLLVLILIFANWGAPSGEGCSGDGGSNRDLWYYIFTYKWYITGALALGLCFTLIKILKIKWLWIIAGAVATFTAAMIAKSVVPNPVFVPIVPMIVGIISLSLMTLFDKQDEDNRQWTISAWGFAKQILPLLAIGVVTAGFFLGSTHDTTAIAGIIPNTWVEWAVGGNSLFSNFVCSFVGAFMYFATCTEVPIVQGLMVAGMGKGPALALLLAGPSLSLPSMLVMLNVMGKRKTIVFVALVVATSTLAGFLYGTLF